MMKANSTFLPVLLPTFCALAILLGFATTSLHTDAPRTQASALSALAAGITPTVVSFPTCAPSTLASAPNADQSAKVAQRQSTDSLVYASSGTTIGQGSNSVQTGFYKLLSYKVERVTLSGPTELMAALPSSDKTSVVAQTVTTDRLWRLVITGGPFAIGALDWYVWFDDVLVGASPGGQQLSMLIVDPTLLREGATIWVGYGDNPRYALAETLHLNQAP